MLEIALADPLKLPTNEPLAQRLCSWLFTTRLDFGVEAIPLQVAAGQCLHLDHQLQEKAELAACERLLVVVLFATDWAGFSKATLGRNALKRLKAAAMEDMRAAQNPLLVKCQVLETNRA